jgi:general secretion pathway protein C
MPAARFQLTPYGVGVALDVLTGLVVVSVAFALAGLTWRLAGYADSGAVTVPAAKRAAPVPDLAPAIALAPFGQPATNLESAVATGLPLQLRGIVSARPESLSSAIIQVGSEVARPFKVGEAVSGATIQAIEPRRVLLMNGGRVEFLAFPDPFAAPPAPGSVAPGAPSSPPAAAVPAPLPVPSAPANPAALLQRLDAQPISGGYRVGTNAPPGLQPGDVLQQVNGQALSSPDAAAAALTKAQASGTAQIQITRDGKPVTLTVPVR